MVCLLTVPVVNMIMPVSLLPIDGDQSSRSCGLAMARGLKDKFVLSACAIYSQCLGLQGWCKCLRPRRRGAGGGNGGGGGGGAWRLQAIAPVTCTWQNCIQGEMMSLLTSCGCYRDCRPHSSYYWVCAHVHAPPYICVWLLFGALPVHVLCANRQPSEISTC